MTQQSLSILPTIPSYSGSIESLQDDVSRGSIHALDLDLSSVTADFKSHILQAEKLNLDEIGMFLSTASRLLLSKSGALLPGQENDVPSDMEARARELFTAPIDIEAAIISLRDRQGLETYAGEPRLAHIPRKVEPRSPAALLRAWNDVHRRAVSYGMRVTPPPFVRLEVAVSRLIRGLKSMSKLSFRSLLAGGNRQDVVIHFLAVLELVRRRQIVAKQPVLFQDIVLEPMTRVTDDVRAG